MGVRKWKKTRLFGGALRIQQAHLGLITCGGTLEPTTLCSSLLELTPGLCWMVLAGLDRFAKLRPSSPLVFLLLCLQLDRRRREALRLSWIPTLQKRNFNRYLAYK